jgi:hypothetical protein
MFADVGEFDGLPAALYYRQAIMVLQRRDLMGQRRLGKVYPFGGA